MKGRKEKQQGTLHSFFLNVNVEALNSETISPFIIDDSRPIEEPPSKYSRVDECGPIQHDPGLHRPIWKFPYNKQDEIRRTYIRIRPFQPKLQQYENGLDGRRFVFDWFEKFDWLEYSLEIKKADCFPYLLFETNTPNQYAFTSEGFNSWKRIGGKACSFVQHAGGISSIHASNVTSYNGLKNTSQLIDRVFNSLSKEEILKNRLRVITTIKSICLLACQACAFRGNDERVDSINRGNFIEVIKFAADLNARVAEVVLDNAPKNATYTSPDILKEILEVVADQVRNKIREEIGDSKFYILVDEAQDDSNSEQMALVIQFVDKEGFVKERFIDVVGVEDTASATLKRECSKILGR